MRRLLIVDDEQLETSVMRKIIEKEFPFFQVVGEGRNGQEAIELSETLKPHIVLMDIKMPGVSGLDAAKVIKKMLPETRIIFLTAFDNFDFAQTAVKLGASDYLLKPVRPQILFKVLQKVLSDLEKEETILIEYQKVKERLSQIWPFMKTIFIYDIINGNIFTKTEFAERAKILGVDLQPAVVMVIGIAEASLRNVTELQRQILIQSLYLLANEIFERDSSSLSTPGTAGTVIILITKNSIIEENCFKQYCINKGTEFFNRVRSEHGISITIGIGSFHNSIFKIRQSYLEAITALRYGSFMGKNQIVHYADLLSCFKQDLLGYPYEREKELLDRIRSGSGGSAGEVLDILWENICRMNLGEELQKACAVELLVALYRAAITGGANSGRLAVLNLNYIAELMSCRSNEELKYWLHKIVEDFSATVQAGKLSVAQASVQMAKSYIDSNYFKEIKLEEVAKNVFMSPYYFSKVFKKVEGITFKNYIIGKRLEQAKKQLMFTQKAIAEIAKNVGYSDVSYFCRIFKLKEGFSPNEFREYKAGNLDINK